MRAKNHYRYAFRQASPRRRIVRVFPRRRRARVPFTPDYADCALGPSDAQYRKLAQMAAKHLGQPLIVVNKPGAGGTTGPALMAKNDKPDGYTILHTPYPCRFVL